MNALTFAPVGDPAHSCEDFDGECLEAHQAAAEAGRTWAAAKPAGPLATEKQVAFILKLAAERGVPAQRELVEALTKAKASEHISTLLEMPKIAAAAPAKTLVEHGFYSYQGDIVKVQEARNGSGRVYAKRLDAATGSFNYEGGLVGKLTAEMKLTAEAAAEFGKLYGICACCGRDLTDETSIALGIGPVCRSKHF